jgi:hypothetical protein
VNAERMRSRLAGSLNAATSVRSPLLLLPLLTELEGPAPSLLDTLPSSLVPLSRDASGLPLLLLLGVLGALSRGPRVSGALDAPYARATSQLSHCSPPVSRLEPGKPLPPLPAARGAHGSRARMDGLQRGRGGAPPSPASAGAGFSRGRACPKGKPALGGAPKRARMRGWGRGCASQGLLNSFCRREPRGTTLSAGIN